MSVYNKRKLNHFLQSMPRLLSLWFDSGTAVLQAERRDSSKGKGERGKLPALRSMLDRINQVSQIV